MGKPSPVPFGLSVKVSPPTCLNCSNTASKSSDAIPIPVSLILTTISSFLFVTLHVTEPLSVNLTEFEIRLMITWISLSLSPVIPGISVSILFDRTMHWWPQWPVLPLQAWTPFPGSIPFCRLQSSQDQVHHL